MRGAHKQAGFLALNPFGQVPVVDDNGMIVADSDLAHAPEGVVFLDDYPKVRDWLARIEGLPGFVGMQQTVVGLAT